MASSARSGFVRSAASVYWTRSLVPIDEEVGRLGEARRPSARPHGTSIITPSRTVAGSHAGRAGDGRAHGVEPRAHGVQLLARRDHRQHHPQLAAGAPPRERAELVVEQLGLARARAGAPGRRAPGSPRPAPAARTRACRHRRRACGTRPADHPSRPGSARRWRAARRRSGAYVRPRNSSSVRTSPMPSAPASAAASASSGRRRRWPRP